MSTTAAILNAVEAAADPEWKAAFRDAVLRVARRKNMFSAIDVWQEFDSGSHPTARNNHAVGPVLNSIAREGLITATESFTTGDGLGQGSRTRSPIRVWRSNIFQG